MPGARRSVHSEELLESYNGITTAYEAYLKGAEIAGEINYNNKTCRLLVVYFNN